MKNRLFSLRDCMCKAIPVIQVNRVVDQKDKLEKMEGQGGGEAQGATAPTQKYLFTLEQ
jgi:hypothetical protein